MKILNLYAGIGGNRKLWGDEHEITAIEYKQMAIVISALRMHTIMMHAAGYDYSELGELDKKTKYWPTETSIGRYFRDAARVTLDGDTDS